MNDAHSSVVLDELDTRGVVRHLSEDEARQLAGTDLVEVRPEADGAWRLLPRGQVGAVRIGNKQVQVKPKDKIGVAHLLFLLGYAADPGFRPEDVEGTTDDDLWPALAESLARQVERALRHGVMQGYETFDESLRTVRGRIRISDQVTRRPGQLLPLEVSYDEFTVDTPENQILRTALRRMLAVPGVDLAVRRRLQHLEARLEGVTVLEHGVRLPRWVPTRLNARYQPALRLSEIVLRHCSAEVSVGGVPVASFVVSMWQVFEQFVTTALTESLRSSPGHTYPQYPATLDEPGIDRVSGDIRMDVDIVHCDEVGRPLIVFDAKYKAASPGGRYANADHYQMLAYCTALQVPVAWLIYAQGDDEVRARTIRRTDITVMEFPLNLAAKPRDLLGRIDHLARLSLVKFLATDQRDSSPAAAHRLDQATNIGSPQRLR